MMYEFGEPESRNEAILQNMLGAENDILPPVSRIEKLLIDLLEKLENMDGGGSGVAAISESDILTLTVAGWNASTKQQTVAIQLDASKRNVIDITIGENEIWDECGVYPISQTSTGITFEAVDIPTQALTFRVCSMEIK